MLKKLLELLQTSQQPLPEISLRQRLSLNQCELDTALQVLRRSGHFIVWDFPYGYRLLHPFLSPRRITEKLDPGTLKTMRFFPTLRSPLDYAHKHPQPCDTLILAEGSQSSPSSDPAIPAQKDLYLLYCLDHKQLKMKDTLIQHVAQATLKAIGNAFGIAASFQEPDVLLINRKKAGDILLDSMVYEEWGYECLLIGIRLHVFTDGSHTQDITAISDHTDRYLDRSRFVADLTNFLYKDLIL